MSKSLKGFVDERVKQRGYGTSSEYVRELMRKEHDRLQLRAVFSSLGQRLLPTKPIDDAHFNSLRRKVGAAKRGARR